MNGYWRCVMNRRIHHLRSLLLPVCLLGVVTLWCAGPLAAAEKPKAAGAMKFEVYQDAGSQFRWRLKAANGQILATAGESFPSKAAAKSSIDRLKSGIASDKYTFELYEDKAK